MAMPAIALSAYRSLGGWAIHPPPFRRCSSTARPSGTERGAEEVRRKVEASIDQPQSVWKAHRHFPDINLRCLLPEVQK